MYNAVACNVCPMIPESFEQQGASSSYTAAAVIHSLGVTLFDGIQNACNISHSRSGKSGLTFFRPKATDKEHIEYDLLSTDVSKKV
jgi:hypothetical protein